MGYKWKQQQSLVSDNMLRQYIGDREGLVYGTEHAIWILLHQEGFSVVLKGRSWHLPVAHQPDSHRGAPQAWLMAHNRTDKVETNVFLYIMQWILLLSGFWWESKSKSQKGSRGPKGQPYSSSLERTVKRKQKMSWQVWSFLTQMKKILINGMESSWKKKQDKHFPGISTWYALSLLLGRKKHPRDS